MTTPKTDFRITEVKYEKSATQRSQFPASPSLPQIAFVGRSNVGKSSLLNTLVNRKRIAHVSSTPGRTQLVNFYLINQEVRFVDLPGYGFAKAPKSVKETWGQMITGYLTDNPQLKVVVALFDIRRDPSDEDVALLEWLRHYQIPFIAVLTKADKLVRSHQARAVQAMYKWFEQWEPLAIHTFSTTTRQGKGELMESIGAALK